jgi:O-antigen/teichoic acid export membrane protein
MGRRSLLQRESTGVTEPSPAPGAATVRPGFVSRARSSWAAYGRASGLSTLFVNAGSLVATTVLTGGLGTLYWWVAARSFTPTDVGSASASIAATLLLGAISLLGTGTLLIGELAGSGALERCRLVATALTVSTVAGSLLGVGFAIAAPYVTSDLTLFSSPGAIALFGMTVGLTSAGLVVDNALIGLLRSDIQLLRNVVLSVAKLVLLVGIAQLSLPNGAFAIYLSLFVSTLLSFVSVVHLAGFGRLPVSAYRPHWELLRRLGGSALQHHVLNLSLQVPSLILPLLVTVLLSATLNGYFYIASMFSSLVFLAPAALSTVLYAAGSREPATFARKMRLTMGASAGIAILANLVIGIGAEPLLAIFGRAYAQEVTIVLRLLVLAAFPAMFKIYFVAFCQTHRQVPRAALLTASGAVLELLAASLGARLGGLEAFTLGYVAAMCVEAAIVFPVVAGALAPGRFARSMERWSVVPLASMTQPH